MQKCIYCNHHYLYKLGNSQYKCAKCKRKFSPRKIERENKIKEAFLDEFTASQASKSLNMHYITIDKQYKKYRRLIAMHSDHTYRQYSQYIDEYDEYLYLPKNITKREENIQKIQHFLTLGYLDKVYNIMMPQIERYEMDLKNQIEQKKLSKYLRFHKVAKLKKIENNITRFWSFFESFIIRYRGVDKEQFVFYLKEAEWRFNYDKEERKVILEKLTNS